jgi:hypothetical protein
MDFVKLFSTAFISQIITMLNAIFEPFNDTIFVFKGWQSIANKSAIAVGFLVVMVIVGVKARRGLHVSVKEIIGSGASTILLLVACAGFYVMFWSGYAPSVSFLYWIRDIGWMIVYILMLVMAGVTIALAYLMALRVTPRPH